VGTGEYVTGYVHGAGSQSDKKVGVVGLVLFDLRRRGKIDRILIAGSNGTKFPGIRDHLKRNVEQVYRDMSVDFESYPSDTTTSDPQAYIKAMDTLKKGDLVFIFTPDDLHFDIAKEAMTRGLHVLITKPPVKTLPEHLALSELSIKNNVLCAIEVHKRYDPMYADAKQRIQQQLGEFSYFYAYMSQPKKQLVTFKQWAGKSSDISYYLNSHHVDFHCWAASSFAKPVSVKALASTGVAPTIENIDAEDTITIMAQWLNNQSQNQGTAVYTASWIAPTADVHSQQRFHYMGHKGEVTIDQAHRGYFLATDRDGLASVNPLYMKYTPDEHGYFSGQQGYGFKSLELFVDSAVQLSAGSATLKSLEHSVAAITASATQRATAILHAARMSIDSQRSVRIKYNEQDYPVDFELH